MPEQDLTRFLLLPKLELVKFDQYKTIQVYFYCKTTTKVDYCTHCGMETDWIHDYRTVKIKDAPHGSKEKMLIIRKKRFRCRGCKKVFSEQIPGIKKQARLTERMQRAILYCADNFANLKSVRRHVKIGNSTIYKRHYDQLELKQREKANDPWPKTVGIDEHSWLKNKRLGHREYCTILVDYNNRRVKELIPGRVSGQLQQALKYIPERENVKNIVMDLSPTYRSFAKDFFPKAQIIADHFHVVKLLHPTINRFRKQITGDKRKLGIRKLLLKNSFKLDYWTRQEISKWLENYPELKMVYYAKEALHKMYRCKGRKKAKVVLKKLLDYLAVSKIRELQRLRKTLMSWQNEILNYFENRITNGRTEGFNNVCKQLQRRAFGFRNFKNYRLKVLYACC